ncbi:YHS domain-containing protein [Nitrospira moscoviensis]|uniref:YHS domain-containing protein n=1 Tax=Nitrospira moscoviensis TaxID=42253 RepID=A0A0K2GE77_NITMO|nr:YHS domain-containing protein [Nitrospira moscoviensis]ALA59253.1 protein of unknown function, Ferritin-like [Nitrospira moscoviensis]
MQTARQPGDNLITEEAASHLPLHASQADQSRATGEKQTDTEATVNDVVCGMALKPEEAAATREYRGITYYFCAPRCKEQFEREPERYASKWIKEVRGRPS